MLLGQNPKWSQVDLQPVIKNDPPAPDPPAVEAAVAPADPNIGRLFGRYRVKRRLGHGGMANVYLAHTEGHPDHEVAIKVLKPEAAVSQATITRFLKEGQVISMIRHPNVIQLLEPPARTDNGQVYLVMELLTGKPLSEVIHEMFAAKQVFTWPRLAPLILQICRALQATHKRRIVHRDMKPSNCFCIELDDEPWHIKVLDFGIAKVQSTGHSEDSVETPLTADGVFVGTPHFAAPEIIERRPEHAIDGRADIFSLGVMMYQCLTGELPFQKYRRDALAALYATARERPEPPRERAPHRDIPPEVDALVMRAMEIDVDRRFANVAEVVAAIRATTEVTLSTGARLAEATPPTTGRKDAEPTPPAIVHAEATPTPNLSGEQSTPGSGAASASTSLSGAETSAASRGAEGSTGTNQNAAAAASLAGQPAASIGTRNVTEQPVALQRAQPTLPVKPIVIVGLMVVGLLAIVALLVLEALGGRHAKPGQADVPPASRPKS